jgi:quercetin dioxygenase-like cupin family protein
MDRRTPARLTTAVTTFLTFLVLAAAPSAAQQEAQQITVVTPDESVWIEIGPGIEFGALFGDWQAEPHGKLVRFAPGVISGMHAHSRGYHAVVIAGTVVNPYEGEENPPEMGPGTYWSTPGGAVHATGCVSEEPCLIYAHMDHLWDYEPADN